MTGRLQPGHKALHGRLQQHRPAHKKPKHKRAPASSASNQPPAVLPLRSRPVCSGSPGIGPQTLTRQILRIAEQEEFDAFTQEGGISGQEGGISEEELTVPPPTTEIPPPTTPPTTSSIADLIRQQQEFHTAFLESQSKMERLVQQATTMLTTQHEATTAILASCKQQLDILESLMRQNSPDWS